jgi:hypothetical protein
VLGTDDLDSDVAGVQSSIRPQVIGWYGLAGHRALSALGLTPRGW